MQLLKSRIWLKCHILFLSIIITGNIYAQRSAVSTNLFSWATLSPNAGVELCLSHKSTLALNITGTPWKISEDFSLRQISFSPEYRYWFKQALYAHYIGINLLYSTYDFHLKRKYYDGNIIALGIGYGYSFVLSDRFNLIPGIGIGFGYNNSRSVSVSDGFKPLITKATITLQYVIR